MQKTLKIRAGITMVMGDNGKTSIVVPSKMTGRKLTSLLKKNPATLGNARLVLENPPKPVAEG